MMRVFKVGQKVKIKERFWMIHGSGVGTGSLMHKYEGKTATITRIKTISSNYIVYKLSIDNEEWNWNYYWLEPACENSDKYED